MQPDSNDPEAGARKLIEKRAFELVQIMIDVDQVAAERVAFAKRVEKLVPAVKEAEQRLAVANQAIHAFDQAHAGNLKEWAFGEGQEQPQENLEERRPLEIALAYAERDLRHLTGLRDLASERLKAFDVQAVPRHNRLNQAQAEFLLARAELEAIRYRATLRELTDRYSILWGLDVALQSRGNGIDFQRLLPVPGHGLRPGTILYFNMPVELEAPSFRLAETPPGGIREAVTQDRVMAEARHWDAWLKAELDRLRLIAKNLAADAAATDPSPTAEA